MGGFDCFEVVVSDEKVVARYLIQNGADKRIFENSSPEIGKRIAEFVSDILRMKHIDMSGLEELTLEQLKVTKAGQSYEVQVDPKTGAVILVSSDEKSKGIQKFAVDKDLIIHRFDVTSENNPKNDTFIEHRYDKNGIIMESRCGWGPGWGLGRGPAEITRTRTYERDKTYPCFVHITSTMADGTTKRIDALIDLQNMHKVEPALVDPDRSKRDIVEITGSLKAYYDAHRESIEHVFSHGEVPHYYGLKELGIKAGILPPEKAKEFSEK